MKEEIQSAARFIGEKLKENHHLSDEQCDLFRSTLEDLMFKRFDNHWHPDKPLKGNAYRCLNINHEECVLDPMLKEAATESFIDVEDLRSTFPDGLALWVDPYDVSYRFGTRRPICPIYRNYSSTKSSPKITKVAQLNESTKIAAGQRPTLKNDLVLKSKLNTSAPSFVPTTKTTQDLSSIWTRSWNNNYQPSWNSTSGQEYYSYFQKNADQKVYNRYHWHRSEKQQDQKKLSGGNFEFRNVAQEAY